MNSRRTGTIVVLATLAATAVCCRTSIVRAQDGADDDRPAKGVQDNSFLLEEAYNQEPGVVQHILAWRRQGRDWSNTFTQEFPLGTQDHQFSYTLPYSFLRSGRARADGVGDVLLNYRYQALYETGMLPAFAPRLSLILPTGNPNSGLGDGSYGFDTTLPFSKIVSDHVTLHANAGLSTLFDVHGRQPTSFRLGGSAVYAVTRDFNVLFETLGESEARVDDTRRIRRDNTLTLSPGARYAFNFPDLQIVVGAAAPIVVSKQKPEYGLFLYLSFEHKLPK